MIATRLPPNPIYTSLYTSLNPGTGDPIPPTGPLRVFIARVLWETMRVPTNQNPNQSTTNAAAATASHSSPAIAAASPANAASPNASRKRKATEDLQESPRRAKFPPGTVGNPPLTNTPPPGPAGITAGALPPNGSPLRPGSVTGMRPTTSAGGAQVKTEIQPTVIPNQAATNIGVPMQGVTQPQQPLRNQNIGTNQPQPAWQALFPPQIAHPYVTAAQANPLAGTNNNNPPRPMTATAAPSGPMEGLSFQTNLQVENFSSSSPEYQRDVILKLKNVMGTWPEAPSCSNSIQPHSILQMSTSELSYSSSQKIGIWKQRNVWHSATKFETLLLYS
jgi:hypothetical protein